MVSLYPELASIALVPVGVSDFTNEASMRSHTPDEARNVVALAESFQRLTRELFGTAKVFASDEFYIVAGIEPPGTESFESLDEAENGVGLVAAFKESFAERTSMAKLGSGFFQSVDGAPALGYRAPHTVEDRDVEGEEITVLTGEYAAPILRTLFDEYGFGDIEVRAVQNRYFGGNIKVAGLMTGADLRRVLDDIPASTVCLVPDVCLSEGRFLDGLTLDDLSRPVMSRANDGARPARDAGVASLKEAESRVSRPQVVIVGRPNVGKSSLVNRLAGKRIAVVEEQRGVTRDRKAVEVDWRGITFDVVDTGGWLAAGDSLEEKVSKQADAALKEADLVILVVDGSTGPVEEDSRAARWVLRSGRPVLLVVNKVDDQQHEAASWEFLGLGVGEPAMVSAQHGRGSGDLLDRIVDELGRRGE